MPTKGGGVDAQRAGAGLGATSSAARLWNPKSLGLPRLPGEQMPKDLLRVASAQKPESRLPQGLRACGSGKPWPSLCPLAALWLQ